MPDDGGRHGDYLSELRGEGEDNGVEGGEADDLGSCTLESSGQHAGVLAVGGVGGTPMMAGEGRPGSVADQGPV